MDTTANICMGGFITIWGAYLGFETLRKSKNE